MLFPWQSAPAPRSRRIFLVARPIESNTPPSYSWARLEIVPRISSTLGIFKLTKHWALCVESPSCPEPDDTFDTLFTNAKYFEMPGSLGSSSSAGVDRGGKWPRSLVRSIEAVEIVGHTSMSDDSINDFSKRLMSNWGEYLVAWWNCQDFALRLAHIVVQDSDSNSTLKLLRTNLQNSRQDVILSRHGALIPAFAVAGVLGGPLAGLAVWAWAGAGLVVPALKQEKVAENEKRLKGLIPELRSW